MRNVYSVAWYLNTYRYIIKNVLFLVYTYRFIIVNGFIMWPDI
jgi:hypothetical protein